MSSICLWVDAGASPPTTLCPSTQFYIILDVDTKVVDDHLQNMCQVMCLLTQTERPMKDQASYQGLELIGLSGYNIMLL